MNELTDYEKKIKAKSMLEKEEEVVNFITRCGLTPKDGTINFHNGDGYIFTSKTLDDSFLTRLNKKLKKICQKV